MRNLPLVLALTGCVSGGLCTVEQQDDGSAVVSCPDGSSTLVSPEVDCSVTPTDDGGALISCADGSEFDVGGETSCTVTQDAGQTVIRCDDGTEMPVTPRTVGTHQLLQPGEYLSVSHSYSNATANAQFREDGVVRNWDDYAGMYDPAIAEPITLTPKFADTDSGILAMERLVGGNVAAAWFARDDDTGALSVDVAVYQPDGTLVGSASIPRSNADGQGGNIAPLADGSFVVAWAGQDRAVHHVNADGSLGTDSIDLTLVTAFTDSIAVGPTSGDGFLMAYQDSVTQEHVFEQWDTDGTVLSSIARFANEEGMNSAPAMTLLPNGNYLIVREARSADLVRGEVFASFVSTDGTLLNDVYLGLGQPSIRPSIGVTADGRISIAYEDRAADRLVRAVMTQDGGVIAPIEPFTEEEPERACVAMAPNGEFSVLSGEGESNVGIMYGFDRDGNRLTDRITWAENEALEYCADALVMDNGEIWAIAATYYPSSGGTRIHRLSRGFLDLVEESDTEVRLYHHGTEPLNITLTVTGAP